MKFLFRRISVMLIFVFAALNVFAGLIDAALPYEFKERVDSDGSSCYETGNEFKASNTEKYVGGGLILFYKEGYRPIIGISIGGFENRLIELGRKSRKYENGVMEGQTMSLTLTNGEVISTSSAAITDVLNEKFKEVDIASLNILGLVNELVSSSSGFSLMSEEDKIRYVIHQLTTYNIEKIVISGISFEVSTRSAPTFRAMFEAINKKYGRNYLKEPSYNTYTGPSATVKYIDTEHNIYQNGQKGMYVKLNFDVEGMKGKTGSCIAYFHFKDGPALNDYNNRYYTSDGKVAASEDFTPKWDRSTFTDFRIFIPYNELHLGSGRSDLKVCVEINDDNSNTIVSSDWEYFYYTK